MRSTAYHGIAATSRNDAPRRVLARAAECEQELSSGSTGRRSIGCPVLSPSRTLTPGAAGWAEVAIRCSGLLPRRFHSGRSAAPVRTWFDKFADG